jgi:hypothetical protein
MRRPAVLVSLALLLAAGVLALRSRRRPHQAVVPAPAAPALPPGPRFLSVPWTLVDAPAERGELAIRYASAEHMQLDRIDAQETPTQVFVTVLVRWSPPAGGWFASQRETDATVALTRPLGERELIHAPDDLVSPDARPG